MVASRRLLHRWTAALPLLGAAASCTLSTSLDGLTGGRREPTSGCPASTKVCAGACVSTSDPAFGCTVDSCSPCALTHAKARCEADRCAFDGCETGFLDCDHGESNGCETDARSDKNCGACGRDCGAEGCADGLCRAVALASNQNGPRGIALGPDTVYWVTSTGGLVSKAPKKGGGVVQLASGQSSPSDVAFDGTWVYWTNSVMNGSVMRAPGAGGAAETLASGQRYPASLAVEGDSVYFALSLDGTIARVGKSGGSVSAFVLGLHALEDIAVSGGAIYFTDSADGAVGRASLGGTTHPVQVLAPGQQTPKGIAADSSGVFWANAGSNTVAAMLGAGAPSVLASGQKGPQGVAVDSDWVYWTNSLGGTVMKARKSGSEPVLLAQGQTSPFDIALDTTWVFWTNNDKNGTVMRVAK
jgi:hypothetical protein